jgi:NADH-quinone oxidoreductase subunit N
LPPLAGFFGKFYLFSAALRTGNSNGLLWLVVLALFGSFISLYYYLIVLKKIFVDEPTTSTVQPFGRSTSLGFLQAITLTVLAAIVVLLGVSPGFFVARILASLS